jgi:hypothetical protein
LNRIDSAAVGEHYTVLAGPEATHFCLKPNKRFRPTRLARRARCAAVDGMDILDEREAA